jgi:hypothetical protein
MKLQILLHIDLDARTRVMAGEGALCKSIETVLHEFLRVWSSGPIPSVKATVFHPLNESLKEKATV